MQYSKCSKCANTGICKFVMANAISLCGDLEYTINYAQTRDTKHKCKLKISYECENFLDKNVINKLNEVGNINPLPAEELKKVMIKDCTNCLHGKYNDYHNQYFCYNPIPCYTWELWEPKE